MIDRVHSVLVDVADLETARRDYSRLLGQPPVRCERDAASGRESAFFALANVALELRAATGAAGGLGQAGVRLAVADDVAPGEGEGLVAGLRTRGLATREHSEESGEALDGGPPRVYGRIALDPASSRGLPVDLIHGESVFLESPVLDADPARISALDHLVVMSPSPDDTAAFYGKALGIRLALDRSFEDRRVRLLFFRVGHTTVEIGSRLGAEPRPEAADRFGGLAWQVPDVAALRSRLAADGFDVSETRDGNKPGTRVCTVREPTHGVPTLLIQPVDRG